MSVPTVTLGKGPAALPNVTTIGYGCMNLDAFMGPSLPRDESVKILKAVYDSGVRHFDTAEIYRSTGFDAPTAETVYNEETVGAFLKTVDRSSVVVATKYFPQLHKDAETDAATVTKAIEDSLRRLGTDYIDLYYLHRMPTSGKDGLIAWLKAVAPHVASKKIRGVGLSEVPPAWIAEAHATLPITAIQQEWSLMTRGLEKDVVPEAAKHGIAIVAYSPLCRGLASASQKLKKEEVAADFRGSQPRFQGEAFDKNLEAADVIAKVAEKLGVTPAQICLAWLIEKGQQLGVTTVVIPGSRNLERAASNAGAAGVKLGADEMAQLEKVAGMVVGERGSEQYVTLGYEGRSKQ